MRLLISTIVILYLSFFCQSAAAQDEKRQKEPDKGLQSSEIYNPDYDKMYEATGEYSKSDRIRNRVIFAIRVNNKDLPEPRKDGCFLEKLYMNEKGWVIYLWRIYSEEIKDALTDPANVKKLQRDAKNQILKIVNLIPEMQENIRYGHQIWWHYCDMEGNVLARAGVQENDIR